MKKIIGLFICTIIISSFGIISKGVNTGIKTDNNPPYIPSNPNPANGSTDFYYFYPTFEFDGGDPDPEDGVYYELYIDTDPDIYNNFIAASNPVIITRIIFDFDFLSKFRSESYELILQPETVYYWGIIAEDGEGNVAKGPIWTFTTAKKISDPPTKPTISAPPTMRPGGEYELSFVSTDLNNDDICYYVLIYAGGWREFNLGPRASGEKVVLSYTCNMDIWTHVHIIAKAIDVNNAQSHYTRLKIEVTRNKQTTSSILLKFLEKIIQKFPILEWMFYQFKFSKKLLNC